MGANTGSETALVIGTIGGDRIQPSGKKRFTEDHLSGSIKAEDGVTGDSWSPVNSVLEVSYQ